MFPSTSSPQPPTTSTKCCAPSTRSLSSLSGSHLRRLTLPEPRRSGQPSSSSGQWSSLSELWWRRPTRQ
ncbi:hypothetical protein ACE6H2_002096 [Prunus campanulata]